MPVSLDEILRSARQRVDSLRGHRPSLERDIGSIPAPPSFKTALRQGMVGVIAEIKRRSPSSGPIREDLDTAERAALYAEHGAVAISVLTDGPYFGGSIDDLKRVVRRVRLPVLRKDFILDEVQILEARAAGAAAVLLIVRALGARLEALLSSAHRHGLDALVEVHTQEELALALGAGAAIIGVNSRDLDTFAVDVASAWKILSRVPPDCIAVAESGMAGARGVEEAAAAGADAVLIGTALSAAAAPETLLEACIRVPRRAR
jgi:indole-3-glycerol phosphate synthase